MNGTALLTAYAVGGGIPPATYEALRVYEDGVVRAVVGNAWPFGAPQDEAGSYEHRLTDVEVAALAAMLSGVALGAAEEPTADSGRCQLRLGDGREVVWSATSPAPEPLGPLVDRLRAVLAAARGHPVGAVGLSLDVGGAAAVGEPFAVGLRLHNPGHEALGLQPPGDAGRVRVGVTRVEGEVGGRPDLEALLSADPLAHGAVPAVLAPGEQRTVAGSLTIADPGRWRLDALVRLDADLPYEGETVRLECVMLAGPAVVTVGA